jgi:hypothetical protein
MSGSQGTPQPASQPMNQSTNYSGANSYQNMFASFDPMQQGMQQGVPATGGKGSQGALAVPPKHTGYRPTAFTPSTEVYAADQAAKQATAAAVNPFNDYQSRGWDGG